MSMKAMPDGTDGPLGERRNWAPCPWIAYIIAGTMLPWAWLILILVDDEASTMGADILPRPQHCGRADDGARRPDRHDHPPTSRGTTWARTRPCSGLYRTGRR